MAKACGLLTPVSLGAVDAATQPGFDAGDGDGDGDGAGRGSLQEHDVADTVVAFPPFYRFHVSVSRGGNGLPMAHLFHMVVQMPATTSATYTRA